MSETKHSKRWLRAAGLFGVGVISFAIWNTALSKVCVSPGYWDYVAKNTNESCVYSPLGAIFRLEDVNSYDVVLIGDTKFLDMASSALPENVKPIRLNSCVHDLRDTVGVLNWHTKTLIDGKPIVIQGGPQLWTNPGFFGARLDTQPWIKSRSPKFPNKPIQESCLAGFESVLKQRGKIVDHKRPQIDRFVFKPNASYLRVAKRAMASVSEQVIWIDDSRDIGENPTMIAKYKSWTETFPEELGAYHMDMKILSTLTPSKK